MELQDRIKLNFFQFNGIHLSMTKYSYYDSRKILRNWQPYGFFILEYILMTIN
jgi:hypothetical protein